MEYCYRFGPMREVQNMGFIHVRHLKPEDEDFLLRFYKSTREEEVRAWGWEAAACDAFLLAQFRCQSQAYRLRFPKSDCLAIMRGDDKIGRLIVDRDGETVRLVDISLLPEHRNQGIGAALLSMLQRETRQSGKRLVLQVPASSPARRLYARMGFRPTGGDGLYESMEWTG